MVARKVSLGCSIRGTTSSKIFATLQITMKSLAVCRENKSDVLLREAGILGTNDGLGSSPRQQTVAVSVKSMSKFI